MEAIAASFFVSFQSLLSPSFHPNHTSHFVVTVTSTLNEYEAQLAEKSELSFQLSLALSSSRGEEGGK